MQNIIISRLIFKLKINNNINFDIKQILKEQNQKSYIPIKPNIK